MPLSSRLVLISALALAPLAGCHRARHHLVVAAAVSLQEPLEQVARAWEGRHPGWKVDLVLGGSGTLLRQIESGAPVDVFASASDYEIETLAREGKVDRAAITTFAHNRVALVAPAGEGTVPGFADLATPAVARVGIGDPGTVPAGRYGRAVLERRGLWAPLQPKLVYGKNVRQVLEYVTQRSVQAGLVYVTDAKIAPRVAVVAVADGPGDPDVAYPAAPLRASRAPDEAGDFVRGLRTPAAQAAFAAAGFRP